MTDNKRKRGRPDRRRVARLQDYEVAHVASRFGVRMATVRSVIKRVGNDRRKVYRALRLKMRLKDAA